jgi:hypothetical protein
MGWPIHEGQIPRLLAREWHPQLGGTIDGFHTVVTTGPNSFAALGERAAASPFADDWAVLRYDSAGTLLREETGLGRPEELLVASSELWHVVSAQGTVNRHTMATAHS